MESDKLLLPPRRSLRQDEFPDDKSNCLPNQNPTIEECRKILESIIDECDNSIKSIIDECNSMIKSITDECQNNINRIFAECLSDPHELPVEEFNHTETPMDLEKAICELQRILDNNTPDCQIFAMTITVLGMLLNLKFEETGDVTDLDKAVSIMQGIIDTTPQNHPDRPRFLSILQRSLSTRYHCTGDIADIEAAICLGQDLVNAAPLNHPERATHLYSQARCFFDRYSVAKDIGDLDEAVLLSEEANDTVPRIGRIQVGFLHGMLLWEKYHASGETAYQEEALYVFFKVIEDYPANRQQCKEVLMALRLLFATRYSCTAALADVDAAVIILRTALVTLPNQDPDRNRILGDLGSHLLDRYKHTAATTDLDEANSAFREVLNTASLDNKTRLQLSIRLSACLANRYSHTGAHSDIEESISLQREIIRTTQMDDSERAIVLTNLANGLVRRYESIGSLTDLDEAICLSRDSLEIFPPDDENRIIQLSNLGDYLEKRYCRIGAISDVEEGILVLREAVGMTTPDSRDRVERLIDLSGLLMQRYFRTREIEDLNEALRLSQEFLEAETSNYRDRCERLHRFSRILNHRFTHSKEIADIEEAILVSREAVTIAPTDHPGRAEFLRGLGTSLHRKFEYHEKVDYTKTKADLDEIIRVCQEAVDTVPPGHRGRAMYLITLGVFLQLRCTGGKPVVDVRTVIDTCSTDPEILADVAYAQECFINALYHESAETEERIMAGRCALSFYDFMNHQQAHDIAKYIINLIPLLASHSLQNSDKQSILSGVVGLSSTAAAVILHTLPVNQRSFAAIECLENGRGLIGRTLLEQHDVSTLKKQYPDLAVSFVNLRDRLDQPDIPDTFNTLNATTVNIETEENTRHKTEKEFTHLLEIIRSKPSFERFLLPATELDMVEAAACGGPIVIVNLGLTPYRCDALIIEQSGLRVLEISELSQGEISDKILDERSEDVESAETLAWLWDVIVCPVLDALGFTETPSGDSWPHVWWILTGRLSNHELPLHAAGYHLKRSGETTLDRVVSSYATSVKSIIHTRRRGEPMLLEPLNVVAVAMEQTDGQADLIHAGREIDAISNLLELGAMNYEQPPPYKGDVLSAMRTCQIFHFAGHGESHPTDPLKSALLLRDWQSEPLTVASLLETEISSNQPFLAYLSACGTGQIIDDRSLDESIHLANAFQLAGFRHVIGTLWSVDDEICVDIAEMVYKTLRGRMHDDSVSRGLHDAVRTLRNRWVDVADGGGGNETMAVDGMREGRHAQLDNVEQFGRPLWIPYVHFGV